MRKVLLFSLFLILGLLVSQTMPAFLGDNLMAVRTVCNTLLNICLSFIMINVGKEFVIDKSRWRDYASDYLIAMLTAAMPWLLVGLYFMFVLTPVEDLGNLNAWKENILLSRFAAPTSAGILFTMLAALGLKSSWIYNKVQVLAIFDDLDTILLMIPLQIMMIGLKWQLGVVILIVFILLMIGWKYLGRFNIPQGWKAVLLYSILVFGFTNLIYFVSKYFFGEEGSIHIEVLLPAFVLGMVMKHNEDQHDGSSDNDYHGNHRSETAISLLFMFLVGMSMPYFMDMSTTISSGQIVFHVFMVTLLSNVGKICPVFFYRDRALYERLAVSVGMFTRGEVGAGIIFIAIGYNIGGPVLLISVLTIVLNLILTGVFVLWVKRLVTYNKSLRS